MKSYSVDLDQMLKARDRRAGIQNTMLADAGPGQCLVCLTLNIAGDVKRTPMTRMLFEHGVKEMESLGFEVRGRTFLDEATGSEAFWLLKEDGKTVKEKLEALEDSFPAARLYDFDVIKPDGLKLSRAEERRCLICDAPAVECARSRRHGLAAVKKATGDLLTAFCASELAEAAYLSLLDELNTAPKPGLVCPESSGAHSDMDAELMKKSAAALVPYFEDAVRMGADMCGMEDLRRRGKRAEEEMFEATGGVNTHKGLVYSMGLLLAGMGRCLREGGSCTEYAAMLAKEDAEEQLKRSLSSPSTNGGEVYRTLGAKGAAGEAAGGFRSALYCLSRLKYYRETGCGSPGSLALCDCMAVLEDTNLLYRGGAEGLGYVRSSAARISRMPPDMRIEALEELDRELTARHLSPGGSADILASAFLLERWQKSAASDTI